MWFLTYFYLCRKLEFSEVRNDTEPHTNYVRVLDPRAEEISFVRTSCAKKQALYLSCENLGRLIETSLYFSIYPYI